MLAQYLAASVVPAGSRWYALTAPDPSRSTITPSATLPDPARSTVVPARAPDPARSSVASGRGPDPGRSTATVAP